MRTIVTAALLVTAGCFATVASACETPVFRYAMYKWAPAPYEIYYFYGDAPTPAGEAVQKKVDALANQLGENANVVFTAIGDDEIENTEGKIAPADVLRGYEARKEKGGPMFAVYSPVGHPIHWGDLSPEDISALCDSPARRKVAAALASGDCCVYVVLDSDAPAAGESPPSPDANTAQAITGETAEGVLKKMLADITSGEISLLSPPPKDGPAADPTESPVNSAAVVRVSRNDPAEAWFVRTLLGVEPDLSIFKEPMVFPVFGRGRVLPPFIGRGIQGELLIEAMEFATGACSCTVKDQNPGVDLLMTEDWEAAAEKLAARFGAEEGNEGLFADVEFLPEILVPDASDNEPEVNTVGLVGKTKGNEVAAGESGGEPSTQINSEDPQSAAGANAPATNAEPEQEHSVDAEHAGDQVAMVDEHHAAHSQADAFDGSSLSWRMLAIIGAGIGVGLLALMAATFFVARPK